MTNEQFLKRIGSMPDIREADGTIRMEREDFDRLLGIAKQNYPNTDFTDPRGARKFCTDTMRELSRKK